MATENLMEQLGITRDDVMERVVAKIVSGVMEVEIDLDDESYAADTPFARELQKRVQAAIDAKVLEMGDKYVLPEVGALIENFTLQSTNAWGEKTGKSVTFIEYLVQRADVYMKEPVDYEGKPKDQQNGYSFRAKGTRIEYMIERHLQYHVATAMKKALEGANASLIGGIEEAVKIKLAEIQKSMQVGVRLTS